ncbi:PREDICTED: peptidyl-prolyl cis-trans isomerase FKBP2 [Nicrophorus vespilloides]|uniref:peptidylprolyl isomerase n=1 Tax=Nicrophorus vespilloides TaxID=110193 RepID=A0ABM1N640_NICVS|nr:PREDICTED: peptidyl-prolyl cis-trans isomerase FKBP2 [Nicrophorus vespilloides]
MKIFICALVLSLALIALAVDDRKLQIGVKKRLLNCETKTKKGDFLHVHYRAMYENEVEFDSSYTTKPFTFTLGLGQVIKGWDQGLLGMCVGEIRKLVVPPHLAYGLKGVPPTIPPDETLIFFIELLNIEERDEL